MGHKSLLYVSNTPVGAASRGDFQIWRNIQKKSPRDAAPTRRRLALVQFL